MNYTKMTKQFVCKMAMPLALMFAACSDNGNSVVKGDDHSITPLGGSAEETGVVAYENISLRGSAYYAPAKGETKPSLENLDASFPQDVFWAGGSVTLKELDSTTLEWVDGVSYTVQVGGAVEDSATGEMVPSNNGVIQFDSVSLKSPIVMLIATSGDVSLRAILDLRDSNSFVVDALSHLTAYRLQKLVSAGTPFSSAKSQAESEMAEAFGFAGLSTQETSAVRDVLNEFQFDVLEQIKMELGKTGSIDALSENTKESVRNSVLRNPLMRVLLFPESAFERLGDSAILFYQECLQKKKYGLDLLARVYGYGKCSSVNEGALVDISNSDFKLECRAGAWDLYNVHAAQLNVNPVLGTMVDSRDGQVYKIVTLDLGETSQTWMAENLNYKTEKSSCYDDDSSYCSVYGRLYTLFPLDSTYDKYATEDACFADRMEVWIAEVRAVVGDVKEDDSLRLVTEAHRFCKELKESSDNPDKVNWGKVIDSLDVLGYDVCPEGWRMPTYEDWETLLHKVEYELLLSTYGNPTGFSMDILGAVRTRTGGYRASLRNGLQYLFIPRPTPEELLGPGMQYVGDAIGMIYTTVAMRNDGYLSVAYTYAMPSMGFVRCIKDE